METVTKVVITTINFIRSRGLNHREFQQFLKDMDSDYGDVTYFTEVRWLSQGKMLMRFYELQNEIKTFMNLKGKPVEELDDDLWLADLAFLVDITSHLNELNKRLQGKGQLIHEMFFNIKAFQAKLNLWQSQLKENNCTHFKFLSKHPAAAPSKYVPFIENLITAFDKRFEDFKENELLYTVFATPFSIDVKLLPENLQLECIDLQADWQLKDKFYNMPLVQFYKTLSKEKYPELRDHALFMVSLFGSTYACEQFFSKMNITKNELRTKITDESLENTLRISCTSIEPDLEKLAQKKKQPQKSY